MKINKPNSKFPDTTSLQPKDSEKIVTPSPGGKFLGFMDDAKSGNAQDNLKQMARKILDQGDILAKRIDVRELKVYKALIKEFLNYAVNNSHRFSKQNKLDRRGRHKVFVTVKLINDELDALTNDVLGNQNDNIKVLKRIEDIRGLILDIEL